MLKNPLEGFGIIGKYADPTEDYSGYLGKLQPYTDNIFKKNATMTNKARFLEIMQEHFHNISD